MRRRLMNVAKDFVSSGCPVIGSVMFVVLDLGLFLALIAIWLQLIDSQNEFTIKSSVWLLGGVPAGGLGAVVTGCAGSWWSLLATNALR